MFIRNELFTITIVLLLVLVIGAVTLIQAKAPSEEEKENIAQVLKKALVLAEDVYRNAKLHYKNGTPPENKAAIIENGKKALYEFFADDLAQRLSKTVVENQFESTVTGPDLIDFGVTNVELKDLSISGDKAYVTAILDKYLVERITRDGKNYIDRMEGKVTVKATLVKVDGKWKISEFTAQPDLNPEHIIQPE